MLLGFLVLKSQLRQHVMDFDHTIDRDDVKILKSESHAYKRYVARKYFDKPKDLFTKCYYS